MKYFIVHVGGNQTAKQLSIQLGCQIIVDFSWAETLNKIFTKRSSYPLHLGAVLTSHIGNQFVQCGEQSLLFKRNHSGTQSTLLHTKIYLFLQTVAQREHSLKSHRYTWSLRGMKL